MATIFNTLIPTFAYDLIAVYDQNFNQVFSRARPVKAVVKEEAKVMEHPLESGATITDHRIILPIEIELSLLIESAFYRDVYRIIKQYYLNSTLLVVQTKTAVYDNQLISSMPHEEDPELYDAITIALTMKQAQFATTSYALVPKNPKQTTTVNRGTQQGKETQLNQSGALELAKKVFNFK